MSTTMPWKPSAATGTTTKKTTMTDAPTANAMRASQAAEEKLHGGVVGREPVAPSTTAGTAAKTPSEVVSDAGAAVGSAIRGALDKVKPAIGNTAQQVTGSQPSGGGSGGAQPSAPSVPSAPITPVQTTVDGSKVVEKLTGGADPVSIDRVGKYDKQPMVDMATQQIEAARQQYNNRIDNATNQGITELRRAVSDAQAEFEAQQEQIVADELNALDNAALYAEARGDKGGIGQAQYGSIQNTAAQNKQAVRNAQTKLAADTSRQISDLRAQGEFDKADAMLELTQTYLAELRNIEEFAANYNLNVDQINTAISQWEAEYAQSMREFTTGVEMNIANMTGAFSDGTPTLEALNRNNQNLAEIAMSLLNSGMGADKLTDAQKSALAGVYGMDAAQMAAYAQLATAKANSGGGSDGYSKSGSGSGSGDSGGYLRALEAGNSNGVVNTAAAGMIQNYLNRGATQDQIFAKIEQMESGAAGEKAKISSAEAEALAAWAQSKM